MDWKWDNNAGQLVAADRPPSPPFIITNKERLEFDQNLATARGEEANNRADRVLNILCLELQWRQDYFQKAQELRQQGKTFTYLRPWPLSLRQRCTEYPHLLEWYYTTDIAMRQALDSRLEELRSWMRTDRENVELAHLSAVEEARKLDEKKSCDAQVLSKMLEIMGKRLHQEIEETIPLGSSRITRRTASKDDKTVTELGPNLWGLVNQHPELWDHYRVLQDTEFDAFPHRNPGTSFSTLGGCQALQKDKPWKNEGCNGKDLDPRGKPIAW